MKQIPVITSVLLLAFVSAAAWAHIEEGEILKKLPSSELAPNDKLAAGRRIFFEGIGADGKFLDYPGKPPGQAMACQVCHAPTREGLGPAANITEERLLEAGYYKKAIARAVREGIRADGSQLSDMMPRWRLSDEDIDNLYAFLMPSAGELRPVARSEQYPVPEAWQQSGAVWVGLATAILAVLAFIVGMVGRSNEKEA